MHLQPENKKEQNNKIDVRVLKFPVIFLSVVSSKAHLGEESKLRFSKYFLIAKNLGLGLFLFRQHDATDTRLSCVSICQSGHHFAFVVPS